MGKPPPQEGQREVTDMWGSGRSHGALSLHSSHPQLHPQPLGAAGTDQGKGRLCTAGTPGPSSHSFSPVRFPPNMLFFFFFFIKGH